METDISYQKARTSLVLRPFLFFPFPSSFPHSVTPKFQDTGTRQQSVELTTGGTIRGLIPGWSYIFRTLLYRARGPPSLLYDGYRVSFRGVRRPGRAVNHPPPSSAEVKDRIELYLYFFSGPSWPFLGRTILFCFIRILS
jgi:hypothetical protein